MKVKLILIGKTVNKHFEACIDDYRARLAHYLQFEIRVLPAPKNTKALSEDQQKEMEGRSIINSLKTSDYVVLLDERGKEYRSVEFASWLGKKMNAARNLVLVIGGPYGFSKQVYDRSDEMISLSKMTFSHEMVRLFCVEQIYRACTILRGEHYHHE